MARQGYFGNPIFRPGDNLPAAVTLPGGGVLTLSAIARATGLGSHVANVKRQSIVMDAATIVARHHGFLTPQTRVGLSRAGFQHFGATGGGHAAHAMKRFTFDDKDIVAVYTRDGVDEMAPIGLQTMLGYVIDVDRRANLSIDKRLENNPQRLGQIEHAVKSTIGSMAEARELARELEFQRRFFEKGLLLSLRGGFGGDARYDAMLSEYEAALAAPPPDSETPTRMVDMIATMIDDKFSQSPSRSG